MPMKMRAGDIWRDATGVWVRVSGNWVRAQNVYARQGDLWRLIFADIYYVTISGSLSDVNLRTTAINNGWDQQRPLHFTIAGGSVLNASSNNALTINGSYPRGVTLVNNGIIAGRGGQGGAGGTARGDLQIAYGGAAGAAGGRGLLVQSAVTIFNNGIIAGGGGGGGGGGSTIANQFSSSGTSKDGNLVVFLRRQAVAGGGGGGAGRSNNFGSAGGVRGERVRGATASIGNIDILTDAVAGGGGNLNTQGGGGFRGEERDPGDVHAIGGWGGTGGFWGAAGGSGGGSEFVWPNGHTSGGGGGGAGGPAITGNNLITWGATGERYGAIQA
jgi:hypothetical protein